MVDKKIVDQVVKALLNQNGGNTGTTRLYGTAVVNNGQKFVRLDGSDQLTTVVEGTEIINGDRVLVSIEDHQAVVLSNVTSPASARTATSFMDFVNDDNVDGLVIGEIAGSDGNPPQSIVIGTIKEDGVDTGEQGVYLRVGEKIIAKFIGTEFGDSKIELGPFKAVNDRDEYTAIFDNLGLSLYRNFRNYDDFDDETRIRPGWIGINEEMDPAIDMSDGEIYASRGCTARIIYVDVTSSALSIPATNNASFSVKAVVPSGYTPCGIMAYKLTRHLNTCCFTRVDVDLDGTINFNIQNHGNTAWTDELAFFQIACIWTG